LRSYWTGAQTLPGLVFEFSATQAEARKPLAAVLVMKTQRG
jgi:hypothetical protein